MARIKIIVNQVLKKIAQINLFTDIQQADEQDELILRNQILSTRLYLALLTGSILILTNISFFSTHIVRITVENPEHDTYKSLVSDFQDSISCPCSQIVIPYEDFFSIDISYHQVMVL